MTDDHTILNQIRLAGMLLPDREDWPVAASPFPGIGRQTGRLRPASPG